MVAEIIDTHFTDNLSYYKSICIRMCNGKSGLDLLHLAYIKLREAKEDLILKYYNKNKLKNLVIYYIRSLFQKRNNIKRNKNGSTSPLYIHSKLPNNLPDVIELPKVNDVKLNEIILKCLSNPETSVPVTIFIQAQATNISEISKTSKLSRPYVTKMYEQGRKILYNQLNND